MSSGYSATTPANTPLDAGLVYLGLTPWGVTRGGVRFNGGGIEWRQIEFDGRRSRIVGLDRIVGFDPMIEFEIIEFNSTVLQRLNPGSTVATAGGVTTVGVKPAGILLVSADYLTNLFVAWQHGGGTWSRILFPKALCLSYEGPSGEDKSEVGATVRIAAALDYAGGGVTTDTAPFLVQTGLAAATTGIV